MLFKPSSSSAIARRCLKRPSCIPTARATFTSSSYIESSSLRGSALVTTPKSRENSSHSLTRHLHVSAPTFQGIRPETSNPEPTPREPHNSATEAAEVTVEEFQELSEIFFEGLLNRLEEVCEEREDCDVEYSVSSLLLLTGLPNCPGVHFLYTLL